MRRSTYALLFGLAASCVACAAGCKRADRDPRRWVLRDVQLQPLVRHEFALAPGASTTIEARAAERGVVPVLHLWDLASRSEVARDAGSRWLGRDAHIAYRNPHGSERRYAIVLRARDDDAAGRVQLLRDGRTLDRAAQAVGGAREAAHGAGYVYDVAAAPGGPAACALYGFGEDGALLGVAEGGGRNGLPRLRGVPDVRSVIAARSAPPATDTGRVQIYANDPDDRDGDGLGRALERALRTCDAPEAQGCAHSPLSDYYRSQPTATRDSDRDGLDDGDELLGVVGAPLLDLPRFGADPRHKDVFVEVDRAPNVEAPGLDGSDSARIAALFARGSARELKNPDGLPGVHLHLDLGIAEAAPDPLGLYGDFGGSGVAQSDDYKQARNRDFTPARRGYFRYALLTRWGTGQASGSAITVNRDFRRIPVFAHELAHTFGLAHYGQDGWGKVNCKPNYRSIMNYVFQNREDVGFSRGGRAVLDPSRVVERGGLAGLTERDVTSPPLEFDIIDGSPDWNRDGAISDEPVRAALTYATYKSCNASTTARTTLWSGALAAATPVLTKLGDRLHALWVTGDGAVMAGDAPVSGPDAFGSCPELAKDPNRCATWSQSAQIAALGSARHIAAAPFDAARLALAIAGEDGRIRLAVLSRSAQGWLVDSVAEVPQAATDHVPAVVWLDVDEARYGATRVLAIMFRARGGTGTLTQASTVDPQGPFLVAPLRDERDRPIESALGPSLVALGDGTICGAFPDREQFIRFYCYEPAGDAFHDLSRRAFYAELGPRTLGTVGLAFHRYRTADGALVHDDPTRGALYMSFSEPIIAGPLGLRELPFLLVSESLAKDQAPDENIAFRWRFAIGDEWTYVLPGTGVALYEDLSLSALKGLLAVRVGDATRIDALPLADGTFSAQLGTGNDFEVMERGICRGLRGKEHCGQD